MTQLGTIIQRLVLGILFCIQSFAIYSQDFVTTKTKSDYPPAELKEAYQLYDGKREYSAALELLDQYLSKADTSEDMRTYIAALEMKFHVYRRQEGVGYEGAFPTISKAVDLAKRHLASDDILFHVFIRLMVLTTIEMINSTNPGASWIQ